jgi:hypothetical protein
MPHVQDDSAGGASNARSADGQRHIPRRTRAADVIAQRHGSKGAPERTRCAAIAVGTGQYVGDIPARVAAMLV